jgi:hypothetical protein
MVLVMLLGMVYWLWKGRELHFGSAIYMDLTNIGETISRKFRVGLG